MQGQEQQDGSSFLHSIAGLQGLPSFGAGEHGAPAGFPPSQPWPAGGISSLQQPPQQAAWQQLPQLQGATAGLDVGWLQGATSIGASGTLGVGGGGSGLALPAHFAPTQLTGSRLDPATMAAKLAAAREKNRLAQQRFRERQRAKQKVAGEQCEVLQKELEELQGENELLHRQNRIYQKVLAVRDAMLHTFSALAPAEHQASDEQQQAAGGQQGQGQPASAAAVAAEELARALRELPSEDEMEDAAPAGTDAGGEAAQQEQQQLLQQEVKQEQELGQAPAAAAAAGSSGSCITGGREQQQAEAGAGAAAGAQAVCALPSTSTPSWTLGEAHRLGTSASLDGSQLRQVDSIPSVEDQAIRETVAAMAEPEHLLEYYREWQAELKVAYQAAQAAGFDAASVAEVEAVHDRMAQVWWHVGELKPTYLCYLTNAALPEDSGQFPLWREMASDILPQLDESKRALLRRCWYNYSKRLAKTAMGVSKWVRRLQEYSLQPLDSAMATNATRAVQLMEITKHVAAAVQEEYLASMQFIAEQSAATSVLQKAYINHASAPFLPDLIAIIYHILCMDSEERQARSKAGDGGSDDNGSARAASAPALDASGGLPHLPTSDAGATI